MEVAEEELAQLIEDIIRKKYPEVVNHLTLRWLPTSSVLEIVADSWVFTNLLKKMENELKDHIRSQIPQLDQLTIDIHTNEPGKPEKLHPDLDEKMTFENFVVDEFNKVAFYAAIEVTQKPGRVHNPLFIYGGYGIGKTHILNAIGHRIYSADQNMKILLTNPEEIMRHYTRSTMNSSNLDYSEALSTVDVLLIDDIQCFKSSWVKTGEVLFSVFNTLLRKNKQIVITSDVNPFQLKNVPDRLRSRLTYGLMAQILPPGVEERKKIIRYKIKSKNYIPFTEEAMDLFARNAPENIREIENLLNSVNFKAKLDGLKEITKEYLIKNLQNIIPLDDNQITIDRIIEVVASSYRVSPSDIKSDSRTKTVSEARHVAIYLIRELLNSSYKEIGKELGRQHSTIISSYKKIKKEIETNDILAARIKLLIDKLKNGQKK